MRTQPSLITALFLLICVSNSSIPANAQYEFGKNGTRDYLKNRIDTGARAGVMTKTELRRLRDCLNRVSYLERHGSNQELGHLSGQMRNYIDSKETRHGHKYRLERHKRASYRNPVGTPFDLNQYHKTKENIHILRSNSKMAMKYAQQVH